MKKHFYPSLSYLLAGALLLFFFSGCDKNGVKTYTVYEPIYGSRSAALAAINGNPAQGIESAGKIYLKGSYIFVSDVDKGVHVIDNRNPMRPVQVAFLSIPGNQDIAIKDNTMYADMYDEMLAIDITDVRHVKITGQLQNLFVMRQYVNGFPISGDSIITGWNKKIVKVAPPCPNCMYDNAVPQSFASSSSKSTGTSGSMAKMVLLKDRMYTLSSSNTLQVINLENASQPTLGAHVYSGSGLETIFPFQDKLFLGATTGVYIVDITNPDAPSLHGTFWHGSSCDPVITDGNYAYVTLHEGTFCGGASNELDVVDVKNLQAPQLLKVYPMTKPMGLTKDGNYLFVCDKEGVKVLNASNPVMLKGLMTLQTGNAYDVIAADKRLLVSSDKGIYQFDCSKGGMPLLSIITVARH